MRNQNNWICDSCKKYPPYVICRGDAKCEKHQYRFTFCNPEIIICPKCALEEDKCPSCGKKLEPEKESI